MDSNFSVPLAMRISPMGVGSNSYDSIGDNDNNGGGEDHRLDLSASIKSAQGRNRRKTNLLLGLPRGSAIGGPSPEPNYSDEYKDSEHHLEHDRGSLNLLDACMRAQHQNQGSSHDENNEYYRKTSTKNDNKKAIHISLLSRDYGSGDVSVDEDITIHDTIRSIVNCDKSWEKVRQEIRSQKLVTSLGVVEACLSVFQEEAQKLREKRLEQARQEQEAHPESKYSRIRKRLSILGR